MQQFYAKLKQVAAEIDNTLSEHVSNLHKKAEKTLWALEKKMINAEIKKLEAEKRKLVKIKSKFFPNNSLQERIENFAPYYAKYGEEWINQIYEASLSIEPQFGILELK